MKSETPENAEALTMALEDVRRIREVLDHVRGDSAIRAVLRPSLLLGFVFAPVAVLYGLVGQWILDTQSPLPWGWSRTNWLWAVSIGLIIASGITKWTVLSVTAHRQGFGGFSIWRKIIIELRYYRLTTVVLILIITLGIHAAQMGAGYHVFAYLILISGAACFLMPLVLPLDEMTPIGVFAMFAGVICLFYWPEYPFYKLALVYGILSAWLGFVGMKIPAGEKEL